MILCCGVRFEHLIVQETEAADVICPSEVFVGLLVGISASSDRSWLPLALGSLYTKQNMAGGAGKAETSSKQFQKACICIKCFCHS